jgi:hypothetical protein
MYSILDIDFDYFNLMPDAAAGFRRLLCWADRPVKMVVERHNQVLSGFMGSTHEKRRPNHWRHRTSLRAAGVP